MARPRRNFDEQAGSFDRRAGLPEAACASIAHETLTLARPAPADVVLEVGAGTGQIGFHLCAPPLRYVGFDSSAAMLDLFAARCRDGGRAAALVHADGAGRWPADDGSVKVVFGSRALHLLPVPHVVAEVFRVAAAQDAVLVVGRVQRDRDSLRSRLRREMHERLRRHGTPPDDGQRREGQILDACRERGAVAFEPRAVAGWPVRVSAGAVLEGWRGKSGMGGVEVAAHVKDAILAELAEWSTATFGSLESEHEAEERYVLAGVRLPAGGSRITR